MKPIKGKIPLGKYESYYSDLLPSAGEGLFKGTSTSGLTGNEAGTEGETGNESEDGGGGGTRGWFGSTEEGSPLLISIPVRSKVSIFPTAPWYSI